MPGTLAIQGQSKVWSGCVYWTHFPLLNQAGQCCHHRAPTQGCSGLTITEWEDSEPFVLTPVSSTTSVLKQDTWGGLCCRMICWPAHREILRSPLQPQRKPVLLDSMALPRQNLTACWAFNNVLSREALASVLGQFVPYGYGSPQQSRFHVNGITVSDSSYHLSLHPLQVAVLLNITGWHSHFLLKDFTAPMLFWRDSQLSFMIPDF